jgi:hypothetical protein
MIRRQGRNYPRLYSAAQGVSRAALIPASPANLIFTADAPARPSRSERSTLRRQSVTILIAPAPWSFAWMVAITPLPRAAPRSPAAPVRIYTAADHGTVSSARGRFGPHSTVGSLLCRRRISDMASSRNCPRQSTTTRARLLRETERASCSTNTSLKMGPPCPPLGASSVPRASFPSG